MRKHLLHDLCEPSAVLGNVEEIVCKFKYWQRFTKI